MYKVTIFLIMLLLTACHPLALHATHAVIHHVIENTDMPNADIPNTDRINLE